MNMLAQFSIVEKSLLFAAINLLIFAFYACVGRPAAVDSKSRARAILWLRASGFFSVLASICLISVGFLLGTVPSMAISALGTAAIAWHVYKLLTVAGSDSRRESEQYALSFLQEMQSNARRIDAEFGIK